MTNSIFLLGGSGYIGQEVIQEAIMQGIEVSGLARSQVAAQKIAQKGGKPIIGDLRHPDLWIEHVSGKSVIINLIQPPVSGRLGRAEILKIANERLQNDQNLVRAMANLKPAEQPILFSVSGTDDLSPDCNQFISTGSHLQEPTVGFGTIGVPIRKMIEESQLKATYLHLGTVYGPGKSFAEKVFPDLVDGKLRLPGNGGNHFPIIHVKDAARAIVNLAKKQPGELQGKSFILTDQSDVILKDFFEYAATTLEVKPPQYVPKWIASLFVGTAMVETMTNSLRVHPPASGIEDFEFLYPTYRTGLIQTLKTLGYLQT